jgi:2'-5' RNA ligase
LARLFIAVDVEDPLVLSRLASVRDTIASAGGRFKPVETHNMHFTIRFLGEVDERLVEDIYSVLQQVVFKPFRVRIKGVGAFPSLSRPRVIWAGVEEGLEELREIRRQVEAGVRRLGFRPEKEDFIPHITLLRVKSRIPPNAAKLLAEYADYEFGYIEVRVLRLKQSILTSRGPIYRTLREVEAR